MLNRLYLCLEDPKAPYNQSPIHTLVVVSYIVAIGRAY